ncbi:MAG: carbamoyltransferase HypF [Bacteroidia bacterium]|nr:carbamoyltransferase HypF [Bacteroidia bacterium]
MSTYHIHIEGQVQGVGFRPFVYRLARSLGLSGTVCNGRDGVHVYFNTCSLSAQSFCQKLLRNKPPQAEILRYTLEKSDPLFFTQFDIVESIPSTLQSNLLITPDRGLCDDCRRELHSPEDRRFHYPFITCINCGPRFSIIHALPYDRENTGMAPFILCPTCQAEYNDPLTRRYFSQTSSCPDCAVVLSIARGQTPLGKQRNLPPNPSPEVCINIAVQALANGEIIALKGIGGYMLICDATNSQAISTLRKRKHRPTKPFALMYPCLEMLSKDVHLNKTETEVYRGIESPILLFKLRNHPESGIDVRGIAPGLNHIGAMQPYTPLMELLLSKWNKPVVATSGNMSGSPIFFEDKKAMDCLDQVADLFLIHNRNILIPQDDSVVKFTPEYNQRIVLRRSRGYAPTYIHRSFPGWQHSVLAMGADLKSTFALQHAGNTYVSQYLGNLENFDTQENFDHTLQHLLNLLDARPQKIIVDKHPAYFSSAKGRNWAERSGISIEEVQHHIAHFAAVLAENELLSQLDPVLGVIWDGTGYGTVATGAGEIWGGEFFIFENGNFERVAHLDYFPHILGDKMSLEPRLSALALCHDLPEVQSLLARHFSEKEWTFYRKILGRKDLLNTSSMGRLFDGVAALLDIQQVSGFEGEAAMRLEALATQYPRKPEENARYEPDRKTLLQNIVEDIRQGVDKGEIAFHFHLALVFGIDKIAANKGVRKLAFSGGVFQNALLLDLIIEKLGKKYELYFHNTLSPNDECISFGQLAYSFLNQNINHVFSYSGENNNDHRYRG